MKKPEFEDQRENFYDNKGRPFLVRCPKCRKENYAPAVATGKCAWCGWEAPDKTPKEYPT